MDDLLYDPLEENVNNVDVLNVEVHIPRRYILDANNPLDAFNEREFKKRYRFSKMAVVYGILPRIENALKKQSRRGLPLAPLTQLLICLRFYATGNFQIVCGDLFKISQPSVSRVIFRVSVLIAALMREEIKMPETEDAQRANRHLFESIGESENVPGLPSVDGAIDCTHVRLVNTVFQQYQEAYRNRKGYFSLNVQAVVGPHMEFLDIVPEWAGSEHDSRIFQNSRIYMKYVERNLTGVLVGDSGYPCLPFLLTPIGNPQTPAGERYNKVQSKTRRIVERAFGVLKRRFPCLSRGLANKILCTTAIIVSCAVLHNISLKIDYDLPEDDVVDPADDVPVNPPQWQPVEGFAMRQALINRLYGNN